MNTLATVLLATAGAAGVGYVYLRYKASQQQTSTCDALGSLIGQLAGTAAGPSDITGSANAQATQWGTIACKALGNLDEWAGKAGGVITAGGRVITKPLNTLGQKLGLLPDYDGRCDRDSAQKKRNIELNGAVVASAHSKIPVGQVKGICAKFDWVDDGTGHKTYVAQIPIRHQNGCVPYDGAPGWEKCQPGTTSLRTKGSDAAMRALGGGRVGVDPLTFEHNPDSPTAHSAGGFPLQVPAGAKAYWNKGQPFVCAGTIATDHRAGHEGELVCRTATGTGVVPPTVGDHPRSEVPTTTNESGGRSRDHRT